jgi:hypothetical protein
MTQQKEAPTHWSPSFSHGLRKAALAALCYRAKIEHDRVFYALIFITSHVLSFRLKALQCAALGSIRSAVAAVPRFSEIRAERLDAARDGCRSHNGIDHVAPLVIAGLAIALVGWAIMVLTSRNGSR